jgi:hypothetical protein
VKDSFNIISTTSFTKASQSFVLSGQSKEQLLCDDCMVDKERDPKSVVAVAVLRIKPRTLHILGKHSTIELYP